MHSSDFASSVGAFTFREIDLLRCRFIQIDSPGQHDGVGPPEVVQALTDVQNHIFKNCEQACRQPN
jgi:hypothetical protein